MKKPINNDGLVTVITPLYNAEAFISQAIESVLSQTYPHWEHLIIDDCSSDTSRAIAQDYATKDNRIQLHTLSRNSGAAIARNKATSLAKGSYIAFLDADDFWHPQKLEKQLQAMQQSEASVSFTNYIHVNSKAKAIGKRIIALASLSYKKQHRNNYIGNLTGMYKASTLGKIMVPNIRKRQDWALWLEAIKRSKKPALGLKEDLAYYRIHPDGMSANKVKLIRYNFQFYRSYLGYSRFKSLGCMLRFFWEYFVIRPRQIETYTPD
ncbi:MAG: glycosyl transferase [Cytophagaceae bacterium]|nr:glycosyl transferase [Cytophagaceae bacterium]